MYRFALLIFCLAMLFSGSALAQTEVGEVLPRFVDLEIVDLPAVSQRQIYSDDEDRVLKGRVPHYAYAFETEIDPAAPAYQEFWEPLGTNLARWSLRLRSHGALSINLGFTYFEMPAGGSLMIHSTDGRYRMGPFTESDNAPHKQLWTAPMLTSDFVLEVIVPMDALERLGLQLGRVNHGYAGFGDIEPKSGTCHVDVACVEDDIWLDQARSVGLVSVDGVRFCSGFLVNNTALDGKPFFITAHHCDITRSNAASVVVIWNHQQNRCRQTVDEATNPPDSFPFFQSGATLRASNRLSDAVLLELDDLPSPAFNVFYAGWDRSGQATQESVVIHHPNTDVKRISFDLDAARPTLHLRHEPFQRGDHLRVAHWEIGSTEGGSSGAPLFDQNRRVVGQLHGGYAACGNRQADWFGRFSVSWNGNGQPNSRFSDWLDPLQSQAVILDGLDASSLLSSPIDIEAPPLGAVTLPRDVSAASRGLADR